MANGFPPIPVYPKGYDSNSTLFLVHNTSETVTTAENAPWSQEITVKPVGADEDEIWADNGFANIEGELFYYDRVEKNSDGKIFKFKRCARNLGGTKTKYNPAGSEVRGFVVAEHHNQLADTILKIEGFVGEDFSADTATLDWRIRNLQAIPVIFDDFTCPDVTFNFITLESDPATGVVCQYDIQIDGQFTAFRLDFGDGEYTTNTTSGTHRYAANSTIDPVVTVSNAKCTLVQSPVERTNPSEPPVVEPVEVFEINIAQIPNIPAVIFPTFEMPSNAFNIPPIVWPCVEISPFGGSINIPSVIVIDPPIDLPSTITITPINIPSTITITPVNIPTLIEVIADIPTLIEIAPFSIPDVIISPIEFGPVNIPTLINFGPVNVPTLINFGPVTIPTLINFGPVNIPSVIQFDPVNIPSVIQFGPVNIPSVIQFGPVNIPSVIQFGPVNLPSIIQFGPVDLPSLITIDPIEFATPPTFSVIEFDTPPVFDPITFDPAPALQVHWDEPPSLVCTVNISCPSTSPTPFRSRSPETFADGFDPIIDAKLETSDLGIPSEIQIVMPTIPDIRVIHDIPAAIQIAAPNIPDIKFVGWENIPTEIKVVGLDLPKSIALDVSNLPKSIVLDASGVPQSIALDATNVPKSIVLDASGIPESIQVVGIPPSIELKGHIPTEIKLVMPDKMPDVQLVYNGAPIEMKIQLDTSKLTGEGDMKNCVSIVPCQ